MLFFIITSNIVYCNINRKNKNEKFSLNLAILLCFLFIFLMFTKSIYHIIRKKKNARGLDMLKNSNYKKYLLKEILFYISLLFSTGSFVQSFMLAKGIPTNLVATYTSIIQIAQTSVMLLASFVCDKIRKVIRISAILTFILPTL